MDENTKKEQRPVIEIGTLGLAVVGYTAYCITQLVLNHKANIEHMHIAHNTK